MNTASTILLADDDPEDRDLMRLAVARASLPSDRLRTVEDGDDLLKYLRREGAYTGNPERAPTPALVLLDLRMPKRDGFSVLAEIRRDPALRTLPVIVLTTSSSADDVRRSYDLGANSYITKPDTLAALVAAIETIRDYWFSCVSLPERR